MCRTPELDGLRGLAAASIITCHVWPEAEAAVVFPDFVIAPAPSFEGREEALECPSAP